MLGEFEYLMLTAAARLGESAYGVSIRQHIETTTGQRCSMGSLYTTLDRLETKGLVKTWMGDPTPQRGGRPKRMVRLTAKGVQAASDFYAAITRVTRGVSWETNRVAIHDDIVTSWLVDLLTEMLDTDERQIVRGDVAESGVTGREAVRDVFGLVIRRQIPPVDTLAALDNSCSSDPSARHDAFHRFRTHRRNEFRLLMDVREQLALE